MEQGFNLANALDLHDRGAVNTDEEAGVEAPLERRDRLANQVDRLPGVDPQIVVGGLEPVDVLDANRLDSTAGTDRDSAQGTARIGAGLEETPQLLDDFSGVLCALASDSLESLPEPKPIEGLQQIVDRFDLESPDRVLVVRRDEHDGGQVVVRQLLDDREAVHSRHLDVEEDDVGMVLPDSFDRFGSIGGLADDTDGLGLGKESPELVARQPLVVDDQDAQLGRGLLAGTAQDDTRPGVRYGTPSWTKNPPSAELPAWKLAESP